MTLAQKLTRHCQKSGKISVDICKGSDLVAHFTLVRGAFRVGDTVLGLLDFSKCTVACFQLSAFLEQTETVDEKHVPSNSTSTKGVRTVLAQHHCCVINTSRIDISLKIPSTATPDFKTSVGNCLLSSLLPKTLKTFSQHLYHTTSASNSSHPEARTRNSLNPLQRFWIPLWRIWKTRMIITLRTLRR
ncbi:Rgp1-domain-containing protein [Rhizoclosmatium globosum]|uniref:Rgp1-domain-containing protein n=1 Tax=Rhizoclosmatium globosum TaxID=329046 RepID=A0A1Y2BT93_9FUNG|nr:Rgp1-domain-containing protein [Rhizoclosmatium globosum]|eukprot:ORY37980.1 Rgp1-domain-containing protein [Rhizoclosmatium globosum]